MSEGAAESICVAGRARACVRVTCILFVLWCALALAGCKYSDVLTEHIEDPDIGVLDETADPIYKNNPSAPERPDLDDMTIDESDDMDDQIGELPLYSPDGTDEGTTAQRTKGETPHDQTATEADEGDDSDWSGEGDDESDDEGGDSEEDPEEESEEEESDEEETEEEPEDDEGMASDEQTDDGSEDSDGSNEGETTIVDPEGTTTDVETGTVAAVGEYATIAQMLGGAGGLVACDEEWLAMCEEKGLFPGELDRVEAAFEGDGTEAGSCDVDMLIDTVKPSVVLVEDGSEALTDSDIERLEEADIAVQNAPALGSISTEDEVVRQAVQEVAAVLRDASGTEYDAVEVAQSYLDYHDGALQACYDANGGFSYKLTSATYDHLYQDSPLSGLNDATTTRVMTAYVDDWWQPGVSSAKVDRSTSDTTDAGVVSILGGGETLDVSDGVGLSVSTSSGGYMLLDYYLQLAGVINNAYDDDKPDSEGKPYILMPGSTSAFGSSGSYASRAMGSAFFFNMGDDKVSANWRQLGDPDFAAVLVRDEDMAQSIVESSEKSDGLYRMENEYQVIVVPSGVAGPWSEGHVDSFLLALWAFRIQDAASLDVAAEQAAEFYSTFFRCADWEAAVGDWDTAFTAQ